MKKLSLCRPMTFYSECKELQHSRPEQNSRLRRAGAATLLSSSAIIYSFIYKLVFILNVGLFFSTACAGENRGHESSRLKLAAEIEYILLADGVCKSKTDCQERKLYFVSPARNGISVKTYSINNLSSIKKITQKSMDFFYAEDMNIYIECFSVTKDNDLTSLFLSAKPFLSIDFKKEL